MSLGWKVAAVSVTLYDSERLKDWSFNHVSPEMPYWPAVCQCFNRDIGLYQCFCFMENDFLPIPLISSVVGIPHFHCGYSIDNSIVKSQNFVYENLTFTFRGQNFSLLCGVARPLFKYSARCLFQDLPSAYSRQRATLDWLDFHETALAFSPISLICHGLLRIVDWPSASKPVST